MMEESIYVFTVKVHGLQRTVVAHNASDAIDAAVATSAEDMPRDEVTEVHRDAQIVAISDAVVCAAWDDMDSKSRRRKR